MSAKHQFQHFRVAFGMFSGKRPSIFAVHADRKPSFEPFLMCKMAKLLNLIRGVELFPAVVSLVLLPALQWRNNQHLI